MISSPCNRCFRKDLPKDECINHCKILKEIQAYLISLDEMSDISAIDYEADGRFSIRTSECEVTECVI